MKHRSFLLIIAAIFSLVLGASLVRPFPAYAYDFAANVYIDASSGTPVITTNDFWFCSPVFGCPTVTPIPNVEAAWSLTFPIPGVWSAWGSANRGLELTDPVTGKLVDSFGVDSVVWANITDITTVYAQLYCVDSSGNISGRTPRISNASVATAVETGDFQLAMENMQTWIYSINVYLKGCPHPTSPSNFPPVANAGLDQAITAIGTVVQLNGSQSYDPDGQPITYQWAILSKPAGSNATLTGATTATPSFVADVHGDYSIQLTVADPLGATSTVTVKVSFDNVAPVANAGLSQSAIVGQTVTLNASGSFDANSDPLTYEWFLTSTPSGSQAMIANPTTEITTFVPDIPGTFVVQLTVNDGFVNSSSATIQIEAIKASTKVTQDIHSLQQDVIAKMAPNAFKNANMQNALLNKLNAVITNIETGAYSDALGQLQNDILGKTDGCAASGTLDQNDWILSCADQNQVYPPLLNIITEVKALGQ